MLAANGQTAPLVVSDQDWPGVVRAVGDLSQDVGRVTGHDARWSRLGLRANKFPAGVDVVIIGTIGRSPLIDALVRKHKLDVSGIAGTVGSRGDDGGGAPDAGSAAGAGDRGRG